MTRLTIYLVFAFTIMTQLQVTSAKPQRRREVGPLQTLELKNSGLPYSKRVELSLVEWNEHEGKCSGTAFWYMGKCNALNHLFRSCERRNEFVALEKPKDMKLNSFVVKPVCKESLCRYDEASQEVWWPSLNKCLGEEAAEDICGPLGRVEYDIFGDAFCKCDDISANTAESGRCYSLFYQGPCKAGEILEPRDRYTSLGKCVFKKEIAVVNLNYGTITYRKVQGQEADINKATDNPSKNMNYKDDTIDRRSQVSQRRQEITHTKKVEVLQGTVENQYTENKRLVS